MRYENYSNKSTKHSEAKAKKAIATTHHEIHALQMIVFNQIAVLCLSVVSHSAFRFLVAVARFSNPS